MPDQHEVETRLLLEIAHHPGWAALVDRFHASRDVYFNRLARKLATNVGPVDQRVVDEKRGFYAGGEWFIKQVENAERAFKESDNP